MQLKTILNWFRTRRAFSSGAVEGMNNNAKVALRKAYGFRFLLGLRTCAMSFTCGLAKTQLRPQIQLKNRFLGRAAHLRRLGSEIPLDRPTEATFRRAKGASRRTRTGQEAYGTGRVGR